MWKWERFQLSGFPPSTLGGRWNTFDKRTRPEKGWKKTQINVNHFTSIYVTPPAICTKFPTHRILLSNSIGSISNLYTYNLHLKVTTIHLKSTATSKSTHKAPFKTCLKPFNLKSTHIQQMHTLQESKHLFIPMNFLGLFPSLIVGSFALHRVFLRFGGCLYATIGGIGKISLMCLFLVMNLQCLPQV